MLYKKTYLLMTSFYYPLLIPTRYILSIRGLLFISFLIIDHQALCEQQTAPTYTSYENQVQLPQESFIEDYFAIEIEHGKAGVTKLIKIVAATKEQLLWIEQSDQDLLLRKKSLENEMEIARYYNNQLITQIKEYEQEILNLSSFEKLLKEKKIKKKIKELFKNQQDLLAQCTVIKNTLAMIDYALDIKKSSLFTIQAPSKPKKYIMIFPLVKEIKDLKEYNLYQEFCQYFGKEYLLSKEEQNTLNQMKKTMLNDILILYRKTLFYAEQARELFLVEAFELDRIGNELEYLAKSLI